MKRAAGPFEILEILGEGSFGTVCVARVSADPLKRRVALKILKGAYATNRKILNRQRDEAKLLSRINHPNIVRVERLMEVQGRPVVVMEHVQGCSLDQLLLRFKDGLPAAIALELTRQTCIALHVAYAEALGDDGRALRVIHRDIKPSNILLSIHGEVKVVDFGIAKADFDEREAKTESVVMGSRPYMAPERLDGVSDNPSVDVYSAGMSLFELLTGRTMSLSINPVNHDQAMTRQLQYVLVSGMSSAALDDLRGLIRRMCAYSRDYRPAALECARDLEQLIVAIDPRYRIGLEEFARTTVLPIYESRPRTKPEDALGAGDFDEEAGESLREVTGALSAPPNTPVSVAPSPVRRYGPYAFVAGLAFVVVLLASLALVKFFASHGDDDSSASADTVRVKVWIPSNTRAQVGEVFLDTAGFVRVRPGQTTMQVFFSDGRIERCQFVATANAAVRLVQEGGQDGLSVDDGAVQPCLVVQGAGSNAETTQPSPASPPAPAPG